MIVIRVLVATHVLYVRKATSYREILALQEESFIVKSTKQIKKFVGNA